VQQWSRRDQGSVQAAPAANDRHGGQLAADGESRLAGARLFDPMPQADDFAPTAVRMGRSTCWSPLIAARSDGDSPDLDIILNLRFEVRTKHIEADFSTGTIEG